MEAHGHDREDSALPLEAEVLVFDQHRDEWIRDGHENQWVVIRAPKVVRFFDSLRDGYLAGLREFGAGVPFMVK